MKKIYITSILTVLTMVVLTPDFANAITADSFFTTSRSVENRLPADELYPRGRKLLYTLYSVGSPEIEKSKQDGFTAIGPFYGDHQKGVIEKAKKYGVKCVYSVGGRIDFVHNKDYVMPTDKQIEEIIINEIKQVADNPEIAFWNLRNEELRHWRKDEIHWLKVATEAVRKADPYNRPVFMYEPCHRNADALKKTVIYQDFSGKGLYANGVKMKDKRIWVRWGVEQEVEAIKTVNPKATPLALLWMAKDAQNDQQAQFIDDWTRHDVYLSLATGAKGVMIWSGYNKRKGFQKHFQHYYDGYAACARELNGPSNLSKVFLFGNPKNDLKVQVVSGPATLALDYSDEVNIYPAVSHLDTAYGNDRYLVLVNSANEAVTAKVSNLPKEKINRQEVIGSKTADQIKGGSFKVELPAYGVKFYKFSKI